MKSSMMKSEAKDGMRMPVKPGEMMEQVANMPQEMGARLQCEYSVGKKPETKSMGVGSMAKGG